MLRLSAWLVPVSSAGLLIKCLHFIGMTWASAQVRPHVALFAWPFACRFGLSSPVGLREQAASTKFS
jgi:hypothetical protein